MEFFTSYILAEALGLAGGLYVAFVMLKPVSKADFFLRGSVSLITGLTFTETISQKLELDITPAAFIACLGAWPAIGLLYRLGANPKYLIELIKAWRK